MSTAVIVAVVVVAIALIALLVVAARLGRLRWIELRRQGAAEMRQEAHSRELAAKADQAIADQAADRAQRAQAEADRQAAAARREAALAEERSQAAERERSVAADRREHSPAIDPDRGDDDGSDPPVAGDRSSGQNEASRDRDRRRQSSQ